MAMKKNIDRNEIIKNNSNVDLRKLNESLSELSKLQNKGIYVGSNYNLGSPYTRPKPQNEDCNMQATSIILKNNY